MNPQTFNLVYLGTDTFPCGLAGAQKIRLIGRGIIENGGKVFVLNRWWNQERCSGDPNLSRHGVFEGIEYIYASGYPYRPTGYWYRKYVILRSFLSELKILYRFKKERGISAAIVCAMSFTEIVYFRLLSLILRFPLVLNYVEHQAAISKNRTPDKRIGGYFFDHFAPRLVDAVLPISDVLEQSVQKYAPGKPCFRVPVMVDTRRYEGMQPASQGPQYLLFCGALSYIEVIRFILRAYDALEGWPDVWLYLVLNGSDDLMELVKNQIASMKRKEHVRIFSNVTDEQLSQLYLDAYALLIPLRATLQDEARFPHKIGEYLAARRPIVTSAVGEVKRHFTHGKNAFMAAPDDVASYTTAIEEVLCDPALATRVGEEGRRIAEQRFDYRLIGPPLKKFLNSLHH